MRAVFLVLALISILSCNRKKDLPKDVLAEGKMRTVLWDMLRADEWVTYEQTKDSSLNRYKRSVELYQKVLQVNGVSEVQFKKSFQYYQSRPDLLKPLFDSLQHKTPKSVIPAL